ncbi:MAG: hypothetical protein J5537_05130 [Lachnospiraceae bacterium]|nr:hypothetical protein [Lachnospiraceae bacterium]
MKQNREYQEILDYMGMRKLPKGFEEAFSLYEPDDSKELIPKDWYEKLLAPYNLPEDKKQYLDEALAAIEGDETVLNFSKFFVWDMCSMRNKYDIDNYTELMPNCLGKYNEAYGFLVLLACVPVSKKEMDRRGIPEHYYEDIPHRMLRDQLKRYIETGKIDVLDMPWKMNFYTLTIFLLDRFLFIPYEHGEGFEMYRNKTTGKVIALNDAGNIYDSEGQVLKWKVSEEWDEPEVDEEVKEEKEYDPNSGHVLATRPAKDPRTFVTVKNETEDEITGNYMNPIGYTEEKMITIKKSEYEKVLKRGDYLIALHIPGGEGYTPERMQNSMRLALEFFAKYYPELDMKGFWSSSWLYDKRLELIIGKNKNITNCQNLMFRYSDGENGHMLYIHLYRDMDNIVTEYPCETSLQKGARDFLLEGGRFCTTGMMILKEEALNGEFYFTKEDEEDFYNSMKVWGYR